MLEVQYFSEAAILCVETITRSLLNRERRSAGTRREKWKMPLRRIR